MIVYDDTIDSSFDVSAIISEGKIKENKWVSPKPPSKTQRNSPSSNSKKQKNILDISNWISESEEDTTISKSNSTPTTKRKNTPNLLNSIPILSSLSDLKVKNKLFVDSDPISESSSSPYKYKPMDPIVNKNETSGFNTTRSKNFKAKDSTRTTKLNIQNYSQKDLKNVNRVTRTKEELLSEMIIQVPEFLYKNKFEEIMNESYASGPQINPTNDLIPLISWMRRVNAEYDSMTDTFIPCSPKQKNEKNLVLYYEAEEFVSILLADTLNGIIQKVISHAKMDDKNLEYVLIIMIEGYDSYLLKIKNAENKKYKSKVLSSLNSTVASSRKRQKKNDDEVQITSKEIDYIFNETQLNLGINFFPVKTAQEAVGWLLSFTYTISFALYDKFERNQSLANLGNVKSGVDTKSTFIQTIRQFKLMTEPRAEKLYAYYNSLYSIFKTYQKGPSLGQDDLKRNIVPPTSDSAMKNLFTSNYADQLIHD